MESDVPFSCFEREGKERYFDYGVKISYVLVGEGQVPTAITFSELRGRVAATAAALRACGVERGDRVVGYLPNSCLAVEAMLAAASIGAVWSSTSPDFGVTVSPGKAYSTLVPQIPAFYLCF